VGGEGARRAAVGDAGVGESEEPALPSRVLHGDSRQCRGERAAVLPAPACGRGEERGRESVMGWMSPENHSK